MNRLRSPAAGERQNGYQHQKNGEARRTNSFTQFAQHRYYRLAAAFLLLFLFLPSLSQAEGSDLAIVNGGVEKSEDAPFVSAQYRFAPGDYLYFTFQVTGFAVKSEKQQETRKIALSYSVVAEDLKGVPLTPPDTGSIETELNAEDKNWTPKRRSSFLLPPFIASGDFQVRVVAKDLIANAEASKSFPFRVGGIVVVPTLSIAIQDFQFFRREEDRKPLDVPAYAAGDTVFAKFNFTGFQVGSENTYHLSYGILVLRPDGKPYLQQPNAAELQANGFYPAQYLPGTANITTSANSSKGQYTVIITVHDLIGNTSKEFKTAFSLE
jgi:hypothetical protein